MLLQIYKYRPINIIIKNKGYIIEEILKNIPPNIPKFSNSSFGHTKILNGILGGIF